jgi:hypothetical protein
VRIVDEQIEVLKKILAEDTANAKTGGLQILEVGDDYSLVGNGVGAGFEQVQMSHKGGLRRSNAFDQRLALLFQTKLTRQRGIEVRHLGAGVQQEVVGTSVVARVVDGYLDDYLVAVDQLEG